MAIRGLAGWCQNLHTAAMRAGYSLCGLWGGTCTSIRLLSTRLRLLAPANSSHLRSLWSVTVQCSEVHTNCSLPMHLQTIQGPLHSYLAANPSVRRTRPTLGLYSIPSRLTTCNTTKLEAPPRGCHTTPTSRIRWPGTGVYLCTTLTGQISTVATYQKALAPLAFNLRKGVHMSGEK